MPGHFLVDEDCFFLLKPMRIFFPILRMFRIFSPATSFLKSSKEQFFKHLFQSVQTSPIFKPGKIFANRSLLFGLQEVRACFKIKKIKKSKLFSQHFQRFFDSGVNAENIIGYFFNRFAGFAWGIAERFQRFQHVLFVFEHSASGFVQLAHFVPKFNNDPFRRFFPMPETLVR